MMARRITGIVTALLVVLAKLRQGIDEGAAKYTILLSMKGPGSGNPFWAAVERGAQDTRKAMGVNLVVFAPPSETDVQAEIAQIEDQIAKRVNAIVVAPTDVSALNTTFDQARVQKIPVLFVDTDGTWRYKLTFFGTDNRADGVMGGQLLCGAFKGKGDDAIITRSMTTQSIRSRVEVVRAALAHFPLHATDELQ